MTPWRMTDLSESTPEHPAPHKDIPDGVELRKELDRFRDSHPPRVLLFELPNGDSLNVGVGGPMGYIEWLRLTESEDMITWAEANGPVAVEVEFLCEETPSVIGTPHLVPAEAVTSGLERWFLTGQPPRTLQWEVM